MTRRYEVRFEDEEGNARCEGYYSRSMAEGRRDSLVEKKVKVKLVNLDPQRPETEA